MICLKNLTFAYPNTAPIFAEFNWRVARGEAWAILGPSGCGKSTLLTLLAGLHRASAGEIEIDGVRVQGVRPRTGLILQDYGLLSWETAVDNISLGHKIRRFYGPDGKHAPTDKPAKDGSTRVDYWMERLRLTPHAHKYPAQLSGGQRQRVAIARTLVLNPDLLLMDEPFSSLDAPTRESLQRLTLELRREQQLTTVIVTHSIEEAAVLGEKILLLHQPPNKTPVIIENSGAADSGFRQTQAYFNRCRELRGMMEA